MNGVIGIFDDLLLYVSAIDAQSFIFNFIGPFAFFTILDGNTTKTKTLVYNMEREAKWNCSRIGQ